MSDQSLKAAWTYFRIFIGIILLCAFVYMMLTGQGDGEIVSRLLLLLIGLLQVGTGVVNVKTNGNGKNDTAA